MACAPAATNSPPSMARARPRTGLIQPLSGAFTHTQDKIETVPEIAVIKVVISVPGNAAALFDVRGALLAFEHLERARLTPNHDQIRLGVGALVEDTFARLREARRLRQ